MAERVGISPIMETANAEPASERAPRTQRANRGVDRFLRLQQAIGNRATQSLLAGGLLQPKLRIGPVDDVYEREADRTADRVMRMPDPDSDVAQPLPAPISQVQRMCPECEEEKEEKVRRQVQDEDEEVVDKEDNESPQRKAKASRAPPVDAGVESRITSLPGGGRPLSPSVRSFFEPRFNHDFSDVRLHTGATATGTANAINARAFTIGRDVVFGAGQYQPESREGRRLLAHELAHVVQQDGSGPAAQPDVLPGNHSTKERWIQRSIDVDEESAQLEQENRKPKDLDDSKAAEIGREVLRTIGYDKLIEMAIDGGLLERRAGAGTVQRKPVPSHDLIQRDAVTWGAVFGRWALAAGVTSQLDSPAPGPADLVALGILAVGVIVATTVVLMAPAPGNVADSGIMGEVNALVAAGTAATICAALELLMAAAKAAGDTGRINRIKTTQKAKGCRHSRH